MTTKTKPAATRRAATSAHPFRDAEALALHPQHVHDALATVAPTQPQAAMGGGEDDPLDEVSIVNGVAIVSVRGMILTSSWWCENYADIVARTKAALASPSVSAVVLSLDSPGGLTAGLFDAMRALRAAKAASGKRMVAHTGGVAYSAAYGLASTCDEVAVTDTAGVGSVGVLSAMCSQAKALADAGMDVRVFTSGSEKTDGNPLVPISPGAAKRAQARVDSLATMLFAEVGAGRPSLTPSALEALDGGVRYGRDALGAGLADRIASLDDVVAGLAPKTPSNSPFTAPQRAATTTRNPMSEKLLTTIAALTGETDPDRQLGAVQATFDAAAEAPKLKAQLAAMQAERAAEKAAAEKAEKAAAFDAALAKGQSEGKLTPAEAEQWRADFTKGECSLGVLEGNLARRAPIPALSAEHREVRAPKTPVPVGASPNAARLAELSGKAFASLSWGERAELHQIAPDTYTREHDAWLAAGCPGNR